MEFMQLVMLQVRHVLRTKHRTKELSALKQSLVNIRMQLIMKIFLAVPIANRRLQVLE